MASDKLAQLREALEKATPGPWNRGRQTHPEAANELNWVEATITTPTGGVYREQVCVMRQFRGDDAALIVMLRNLAPALLEVADAARDHDHINLLEDEIAACPICAALEKLDGE